MKKHILSKYSEMKNHGVIQLPAYGSASKIRIAENSELDGFSLEPTAVTETVETSDPDEFILQAPTLGTFQKEDSDPDEFLIGVTSNCYGEDFDSILLI